MHRATKKDRIKVVRIIEESFKENPSVTWVVKNDNKKSQRLTYLAEYIFDLGLLKKGVYLSTDETAVAVCYKYNINVNFLIKYYYQIRLLCKAIGFRKVGSTLERQSYFKKHRRGEENFLYFWVFGASDEGKGHGGAKELQSDIFQLSKDMNLPIYLETSVRKNKVVYERFGFSIYHTWHVEEQGIDLWFMKRDP
jgi:hypothetical protein